MQERKKRTSKSIYPQRNHEHANKLRPKKTKKQKNKKEYRKESN
jgi:hypothetical protein